LLSERIKSQKENTVWFHLDDEPRLVNFER
jgi:hypothetical protein